MGTQDFNLSSHGIIAKSPVCAWSEHTTWQIEFQQTLHPLHPIPYVSWDGIASDLKPTIHLFP